MNKFVKALRSTFGVGQLTLFVLLWTGRHYSSHMIAASLSTAQRAMWYDARDARNKLHPARVRHIGRPRNAEIVICCGQRHLTYGLVSRASRNLSEY